MKSNKNQVKARLNQQIIVILNDIRSRENVGSIFRTTDAVGFNKIYLTGITPNIFDRFGRLDKKIAKTSLGSTQTITSEYYKDIYKLLNKLILSGYKIISLEQNHNSIDFQKIKKVIKKEKLIAIVLGNEVDGINQKILNKSDYIVEIPMYGKKESLNVAVSFAVLAYSLI